MVREELLKANYPKSSSPPSRPVRVTGAKQECPICGEYGQGIAIHDLTRSRGRRHMQMHASSDDLSRLEEIKVLRMPEGLLTDCQRRKRVELRQQGVEDAF